MKTAAIVIDNWKWPVFDRHLKAAGYEPVVKPGITPETMTLMVEYEWVAELQPVVEAANEECRKQKDTAG